MDQATTRRKVFEGQPIAMGVEAREEACRETPPEKGDIITGKNV